MSSAASTLSTGRAPTNTTELTSFVIFESMQVGETISKQIVDSVKRSRKTLIVLSENYMQSNWTKLEFQAAKNLTKKDNIEVCRDC